MRQKIFAMALVCSAGVAYGADDKDALIKDALSAASPEIAKTATVMDWDHSVLRKGTGAYTCMPTPPEERAKGARDAMCIDKVWQEWFKILDNFRVKENGHTQTAKYLRDKHRLRDWWSQAVTIRYEWERGLRRKQPGGA